jgi:transposase
MPPKANRKTEIAFDKEVYKWRHLVENFFVTIHEFRGIGKIDESCKANWFLTAAIIAGR